MSTPAADRRAIVRRSIECALGLNAAIRDRQTAPLTAAVWRVVEPALAQRDAQLDAVREVAAAMGGITGAGFWAEQLRAALRPQPPAAAVPQPPLTWCAASMPGVGGEPIGPCVLRHGHDGPVHQAADGAKWWPTDAGPIPGVRPTAEILADPAIAEGTVPDTKALYATWEQHFANHVMDGTICIHSASRIAEALDNQQEQQP